MDKFAWEQRKNPEVTKEGGEPMKGMGYAGKISNSGTQEVKAPAQVKGKKGTSKVTRGKDLRQGK